MENKINNMNLDELVAFCKGKLEESKELDRKINKIKKRNELVKEIEEIQLTMSGLIQRLTNQGLDLSFLKSKKKGISTENKQKILAQYEICEALQDKQDILKKEISNSINQLREKGFIFEGMIEKKELYSYEQLMKMLKKSEAKIIQTYEEKEVIEKDIKTIQQGINNEQLKEIIYRSLDNQFEKLREINKKIAILEEELKESPKITNTKLFQEYKALTQSMSKNQAEMKKIKNQIAQNDQTIIEYKCLLECKEKEEVIIVDDCGIPIDIDPPKRHILLRDTLKQNIRDYLKLHPKTTLEELIDPLFKGHNKQTIKRHYTQFFKEKAEEFKQKLNEVKTNE